MTHSSYLTLGLLLKGEYLGTILMPFLLFLRVYRNKPEMLYFFLYEM